MKKLIVSIFCMGFLVSVGSLCAATASVYSVVIQGGLDDSDAIVFKAIGVLSSEQSFALKAAWLEYLGSLDQPVIQGGSPSRKKNPALVKLKSTCKIAKIGLPLYLDTKLVGDAFTAYLDGFDSPETSSLSQASLQPDASEEVASANCLHVSDVPDKIESLLSQNSILGTNEGSDASVGTGRFMGKAFICWGFSSCLIGLLCVSPEVFGREKDSFKHFIEAAKKKSLSKTQAVRAVLSLITAGAGVGLVAVGAHMAYKSGE